MQVTFGRAAVKIDKTKHAYKKIRAFSLLQKKNNRPPLLCLHFRGISRTIPLPEAHVDYVLDVVKKHLKKAEKPMTMDKMRYLLKI